MTTGQFLTLRIGIALAKLQCQVGFLVAEVAHRSWRSRIADGPQVLHRALEQGDPSCVGETSKLAGVGRGEPPGEHATEDDQRQAPKHGEPAVA